MINFLKHKWIFAVVLIFSAGLAVGIMLTKDFGGQMSNDFSGRKHGAGGGPDRSEAPAPPAEIWCLGITVPRFGSGQVDTPASSSAEGQGAAGLVKVQDKMNKLKEFVEKRVENANTENEQVFYTLKAEGKPTLKTFYAISGQTEKSIKDYFMASGSEFLNFSGGLEFGGNETIDYMTQRLKQLIGEQTSCNKLYIYNLGDEVPANIVDWFGAG